MKDKKRKYILMIILLGVLMLLSGCVRKECEEKVKDLEFTVTKEEELPEALRQQIEEKKEGDFRFTYSDNEYLYEDCYLSDTAICVKTRLQGPENGEEVTKAPSYPFIVLKLELREEEVLFQ